MLSRSFFIFLTFLLFVPNVYAKKVLLDPGHGGEDCGAKGKIWKKKKLQVVCEKDIALNIAKQIKKYIDMSGRHSAYLTRVTDKTLTLEKRSKMADFIKADIFVSIHLNASTTRSSHGFETFYLDNHRDAAVHKIEKVENKDVTGEEKVINTILADLVIERVAPKSKELGQFVHDAIKVKLVNRYKVPDRGLKPGLFYVLALSKRPSILLEAGFLTNQKEASLMNDSWFQRVYAKNVAKGIVDFLDKNSQPNLF